MSFISQSILRLAFVVFSMSASSLLAAEETENPSRANDLLYGEILFNYFQGASFEALSLIGVSEEKGGIQGHGDHPQLIKGGLMLAYGMTRSAHDHFSRLLTDEMAAALSPQVRNQAWFYLGKVFYLEGDLSAARNALERVDYESLELAEPNLAFEWQYLLAQITLSGDDNSNPKVSSLDGPDLEIAAETKNLWAVYTLYNEAAWSERNGNQAEALRKLEVALQVLENFDNSIGHDIEAQALKERILLSKGQLLLRSGSFEEAISDLNKVPFDSLVAEEALFYYAVAQSHLDRPRLAISALNRLNDKPLFTPWLQQVPFALAYLYEQLDDPSLAVQAYKAAGDHYDDMISELSLQRERLDESTLLAALEIPFGDTPASGLPLQLGDDVMKNDGYGRIDVRPSSFYIAKLLSTETFQLALRDLHEMYKLRSSLSIWSRRVESFRIMLETRKQQRQERLSNVSETLASQNAEKWDQRFENYKSAIDTALVNEDFAFFMSEEQLEIAEVIRGAKATLSQLPEGEDRTDFSRKLERIEKFFEWQLADQFGVNRWQAQKEIGQLEKEMDEFNKRRDFLQSELASTGFQSDLERRVADSGKRIAILSADIEQALEMARAALIAQVDIELERQIEVVTKHRLSARHAQARLTDLLYRDELSNLDSTLQPEFEDEGVESVNEGINEVIDESSNPGGES
jgi:hypothetical protein